MNPRARGPAGMRRAPMMTTVASAQPAALPATTVAPNASVASAPVVTLDAERDATFAAPPAVAAPTVPVAAPAPVAAPTPIAPQAQQAAAQTMTRQQIIEKLAELNAIASANAPKPPPSMHVRGRPQLPQAHAVASTMSPAPAGQLKAPLVQAPLVLPTFEQLGTTSVGWLSASDAARFGVLGKFVPAAGLAQASAMLTQAAITQVRARPRARAAVAPAVGSPYTYTPHSLQAPSLRTADLVKYAPAGQVAAPVGQQVANGAAGLAIGALVAAGLLFVAIEASKS